MGSKRVSRKSLVIASVVIVMTAVLLIPIFSPRYQAFLSQAVGEHPAYAFLIVVFARFLAIVIAPLPGQPVAFVSLAVMPWKEAWLANLIGADLGALVAFMIARKFREPAVAHFTGLAKMHAFEDAISRRAKFWGFLGLRIAAASALDFFSYAAGLSKVSFRIFALATVLADIPITFAFFYLGGIAARFGMYFMIGFMALFMVAAAVFARQYEKGKIL